MFLCTTYNGKEKLFNYFGRIGVGYSFLKTSQSFCEERILCHCIDIFFKSIHNTNYNSCNTNLNFTFILFTILRF